VKDEQDEQVQTAIRIPKSWLQRLDKIAEEMNQPALRILRADALRIALHTGIEALEAKSKKR